MVLFLILASTFLVSIISLIGILTFAINEKLLHRITFCLIGFSAGGLIGGAFLHILPEVLKKAESVPVFSNLIMGIIIFFLLERYFYWRHCHEGVCDVHAFTYLNLIGDALHNFIDGMVIAASYLVSVKLGAITTLAVIFHEIPQELGDFGVLVYGGFSKKKALAYNFLSALTAIAGAIVGYLLTERAMGFSLFILPLTAGGFIYIATSDLIPQLHKESSLRRSTLAFLSFIFGIAFMFLARVLIPE